MGVTKKIEIARQAQSDSRDLAQSGKPQAEIAQQTRVSRLSDQTKRQRGGKHVATGDNPRPTPQRAGQKTRKKLGGGPEDKQADEPQQLHLTVRLS